MDGLSVEENTHDNNHASILVSDNETEKIVDLHAQPYSRSHNQVYEKYPYSFKMVYTETGILQLYNEKYFIESISLLKTEYSLLNSQSFSKSIVKLNHEIEEFVKLISPKDDEIKGRKEVINRLSKYIEDVFPGSKLVVYGSYSTQLYLPNADIDVSVVTSSDLLDDSQKVLKLSRYLQIQDSAVNVRAIPNTYTPIVKLIDKETGIDIDISFERYKGVKDSQLISKWVKLTSGLKELVLILKQFLADRSLNIRYYGGLSGFATVCLVYAFLRNHPKLINGEINPLQNLGLLLLEFFEFYAYNVKYDIAGIEFTDNMEPFFAFKSHSKIPILHDFSLMTIEDPNDITFNLTGNMDSHNFTTIRASFIMAYEKLVNCCREVDNPLNNTSKKQTILDSIILENYKERG